jgi:hypothetical protein
MAANEETTALSWSFFIIRIGFVLSTITTCSFHAFALVDFWQQKRRQLQVELPPLWEGLVGED